VTRVTVELEVPFHDVDGAHIVWHGHYLKYFEIARTALFRAFDLDVADVVGLGLRMVIVESRCRHHLPLRYGDRFRVEARFALIEPYLKIHFDLYRQSDERRAARGYTSAVLTDAENRRLTEVPDAIKERFARHGLSVLDLGPDAPDGGG